MAMLQIWLHKSSYYDKEILWYMEISFQTTDLLLNFLTGH